MTRKERHQRNKNKELLIKIAIILVPIIICSISIGYAYGMQERYEGLKQMVLKHNGTLIQLKLKLE